MVILREPTHKHTNTQTHKHTNTQTHKHTNTQTHKQTHPRINRLGVGEGAVRRVGEWWWWWRGGGRGGGGELIACELRPGR